jgi:hypothetical protein
MGAHPRAPWKAPTKAPVHETRKAAPGLGVPWQFVYWNASFISEGRLVGFSWGRSCQLATQS